MYKNLKALRQSLNMSQKEFAASLGIGYTTYNGYETGARDPKSDFWIAVAEKYGVTIDYLMGFSDDPHGYASMAANEPISEDERQKRLDWLQGLSDHPQRIEPASQFPIINQMIAEYSEALNDLAKAAEEKGAFDALFNNPVHQLFGECIPEAWAHAVNRCKWVIEHLETFLDENGVLNGDEIMCVLQGEEKRPRR